MGPGDREEHGEDREAEVVHTGAPEHVAEPAEADHQHRGDPQVAHDQPEQVADAGRCERVDADPRKMSGNAMSRIDMLIVTFSTPSVVFERATDL